MMIPPSLTNTPANAMPSERDIFADLVSLALDPFSVVIVENAVDDPRYHPFAVPLVDVYGNPMTPDASVIEYMEEGGTHVEYMCLTHRIVSDVSNICGVAKAHGLALPPYAHLGNRAQIAAFTKMLDDSGISWRKIPDGPLWLVMRRSEPDEDDLRIII